MHLLEHSGVDQSVGPSIDPVGPVGPYVTRGPLGSYGLLSPCISDSDPDQPVADGSVGPYVPEPLEHSVLGAFGCGRSRPVGPSIDPVGPVGPYITRGRVGSYGMLSPCDSYFDADQPEIVGPVGPCVACGPVGSYGMLSPCDSDFDPDQPVADGPVGSYVSCRPVGSSRTLSPGDSDNTGPVMPVNTLPWSPHGGGDCMDRHDEWSGSDVAETPSSAAVVDMRAGSTVSDVSSNGGDDGED